MSNIDYVINLCHDINLKGKNPSVALIRSSASMPLPIPDVIKAIKHWKANPEYRPTSQKAEIQKKTPPPQKLEQRVTQLEKQLADVLNEMAVLKSKIN
jgi:hypothetical protein